MAPSIGSHTNAPPESLLHQWQGKFAANDDDGDGVLTLEQVSVLLRNHEFASSAEYRVGFGTADRLVAAACPDGTVTIVQLVDALTGARITEKADAVREDFDWIDADHDGVITKAEMAAHVKDLITSGDHDELAGVYFQTADGDTDGHVTLEEFAAFKKKRRN